MTNKENIANMIRNTLAALHDLQVKTRTASRRRLKKFGASDPGFIELNRKQWMIADEIKSLILHLPPFRTANGRHRDVAYSEVVKCLASATAKFEATDPDDEDNFSKLWFVKKNLTDIVRNCDNPYATCAKHFADQVAARWNS